LKEKENWVDLRFTTHTKEVANSIDNTDEARKSGIEAGDVIGLILSGIAKVCEFFGCNNWFEW
jgi:hypothetical protein